MYYTFEQNHTLSEQSMLKNVEHRTNDDVLILQL